MICYDSMYPEQVAVETIVVKVRRNENAPIFVESEYRIELTESQRLGSSIVQLEASDLDGDDLIYTATGTDDATRVFFVNPDSGLVMLKRPLDETVETNFRVRKLMKDMIILIIIRIIITIEM